MRMAKAMSTGGLSVMIVFLSAFMIVGAWLMALQVYRMKTWRPVPATVISTSVKSVCSHNKTTYRPTVHYRYQVNGRTYEATRVTALIISRGSTWARGMIAKYQPGTSTTAYVNPTAPDEAFLDPTISLLPLIFVALPLLIIATMVRSTRAMRRRAQQVLVLGVPVVDGRTLSFRRT